MARPKEEGLSYFSHDCDAASDEKIESLRALFGNDGYAFYFILLERIYRTPDFRLNISQSFSLQILAKKVGVTQEKFTQMLELSFEIGLFDKELFEKGYISSPGIMKRAEKVQTERKKKQDYYERKRKGQPDDSSSEVSPSISPQVSPPISDGEIQGETRQSKVNKSKLKESKVNNNDNIIIEGSDFISRIYIRCFSRPPNRADLHLTENLIKEFGEELTERSFMKAREQLGDKITLAYIRGICSNEFNNVEKPNVRQTNARFPLPAGHSNSNNGKRGYSNAVWDSEPTKTAQDKQPPG